MILLYLGLAIIWLAAFLTGYSVATVVHEVRLLKAKRVRSEDLYPRRKHD